MKQESLSFPYSEKQIREMYHGPEGLKQRFLKEAARSNGLPTPPMLAIGEEMVNLSNLENTPESVRMEIPNLIARIKD